MSSITRSLSFGEAEGGENDYGGAGMPPAPFSSPRTGGGDDYGLARVSPETAPSAVSPQTVEIISTPRGSTTETGTDLFSERTGSYRDQSRDPFGMPTAGNSYSFAGLQAHIDDLTQEKYELQRGMESQAKMAQSLAEENEALAERFNGQGRELEAARKELEQCRAEVRAQGMAMESLANERDGCKAGAQEALERVQAMVEENVGLEERVRELRVKEIRLTKQLEDSQEECRSLGSVLQKLRGERDWLLEAGPKGQPEGTEGKGPGEEGNPKSHMAPPSPPVQTRSTGMQTEPIPPDTPPPAPSAPHTPQQEALALGRTRDLGAGPTGQDLGPREELVPDVAPLALLGTLTAEVSGLGDEEGRVMGAIDGLLDGLQEQRRVMVARLHASKAEITNLRAANQDLSRKLQSQTHKLELSLRSNGGLGQQPYDDRPVSPPISPAKSEPIAMRPREQHPPQQRGWVGWMFGQPRQLARGRLT
ncbi:unnamed protein product [Ostreobium quekettii]|uniref:Uncharacterized protein n=1 Tax=Ostreobium quekettii TaxID=121088 RepID=A0A8S1JGQ4_9CHLO|nr:unnamed protein product [Ostreobium quekettii]